MFDSVNHDPRAGQIVANAAIARVVGVFADIIAVERAFVALSLAVFAELSLSAGAVFGLTFRCGIGHAQNGSFYIVNQRFTAACKFQTDVAVFLTAVVFGRRGRHIFGSVVFVAAEIRKSLVVFIGIIAGVFINRRVTSNVFHSGGVVQTGFDNSFAENAGIG